ncbi:helix-turn-helix domain-containing protein [Nocardia sp. CDC153]|uniref:GbsR/MarR family transcriptional regulator n=1 Tax=Nocardia sp. CDC153 TaxID=3112167 RepID=UPI002DBAE994|nr:helix-turn-helix domain-containing protein [Nocardia sp. CDC153]MEC3958900.1 helix-turn-helix domain-containing protein [Nocardia sp. CDC153]
MPGGRLTQQERRQIAAGLSEKLSYAAIGKRLQRPTSTITREVMRNGGPNDYRADRAHHQSGLRARRNRRAHQPIPDAYHDTDGRDPHAVREFTAHFTTLLDNTGIPRMMAGVLACLYATDSGSLTSAELVARLQVSPASISKAVGYLEAQELIRRERDPAGRRDRYVIDEDVWYRAMLASAQLNNLVATAARDGADTLGPATPAGIRLRAMAQFLGDVGQDLIESAQRRRTGE